MWKPSSPAARLRPTAGPCSCGTPTNAYVLMEAVRRLALRGAELARAQVTTRRLELLKIGAVILRNTRRVRFLLSSACPCQELLLTAAARLGPE